MTSTRSRKKTPPKKTPKKAGVPLGKAMRRDARTARGAQLRRRFLRSLFGWIRDVKAEIDHTRRTSGTPTGSRGRSPATTTQRVPSGTRTRIPGGGGGGGGGGHAQPPEEIRDWNAITDQYGYTGPVDRFGRPTDLDAWVAAQYAATGAPIPDLSGFPGAAASAAAGDAAGAGGTGEGSPGGDAG